MGIAVSLWKDLIIDAAEQNTLGDVYKQPETTEAIFLRSFFLFFFFQNAVIINTDQFSVSTYENATKPNKIAKWRVLKVWNTNVGGQIRLWTVNLRNFSSDYSLRLLRCIKVRHGFTKFKLTWKKKI